jgi:hypothetical protein
MSTERDVTAIVRSWLDEGSTRLPDRVLDGVLDRVPATPQRHGLWPARRFSRMNGSFKLLLAGAAAIAAVVVAFALLPRSNPEVGPGATTVVTPGPSASPTIRPSPTGPRALYRSAPALLAAGDYVIDQLFDRPITLRLPANWTGLEHSANNALLVKTVDAKPFGTVGNTVLLGIYAPDGVFADPCHDAAPAEPRPATVDAFVAAITHAVGVQAGAVSDSTLGGRPAKVFDLNNTIDGESCLQRPFSQWTFPYFTESRGNGTSFGPDVHQRIWILDVGGTTILVNADFGADAYPGDSQELLQVVDSIRFE